MLRGVAPLANRLAQFVRILPGFVTPYVFLVMDLQDGSLCLTTTAPTAHTAIDPNDFGSKPRPFAAAVWIAGHASQRKLG